MPRCPTSDVERLASSQPDDRFTFTRKAEPEDIAAYVHSGGTTGSPKLVKLTHRGFSYKFWANTLVMAHTANDVIFSDYPMFHIAGFFGRGIMAIANGMEIVIPSPIGARDKHFIENYWKFVEKFRISVLSGVPTTLAQLSKLPTGAANVRSLRPYAVTGSTAFPAEVARQLEKTCGVRMMASYGATEYTQNVAQPPRDGDARYGSAGLRLPYTQIKIVDIDDAGNITREHGVDEIGLVVVKGPSVTPGYVDDEANKGILLPDGWFNSGDLGRIDADGYLWITGRAKDIIIRGGHNIDPTVIEDTLLKHPEVVLAAAVSMPDSYAGELPVAYVQLVAERQNHGGRGTGVRGRQQSGTRGGAQADHPRRQDAADRRRQAREGAASTRRGATRLQCCVGRRRRQRPRLRQHGCRRQAGQPRGDQYCAARRCRPG